VTKDDLYFTLPEKLKSWPTMRQGRLLTLHLLLVMRNLGLASEKGSYIGASSAYGVRG
jgi:hypothetical protein